MTYHRLSVARARARRHARLMASLGSRDFWYSPRTMGRLRKTRVACSCPWCGHRRALMGPPVQELRVTSGDETLRLLAFTDGTT